jgi:xanthine/uracil permease
MKNQFLADLAARLLSRNPKFFKYIQILSAAIVALSALIDQLHASGIALPAWVEALSATAVKVGGITAIIVSQLPQVDPTPSNQNPNT